MKIWYDACTGKHVRYGVALAKHLRNRGHEIILTTRKHPDTIKLANKLGEKPIIAGKYNPETLVTRLEESAKRILELLKLFKDDLPNVAIAHQSVELCRIAFGLKTPIILTADTPYAEAVNRLTIPLADTLIFSKAIPTHVFQKYGAQKIKQFNGVDEVAWIQNFQPSKEHKFAKQLIVVRQLETRASYVNSKSDVTEKIAAKLRKLGNVLFIPRFETKEQRDFMDTAELVAHADLFVGAGGTIAREAALQGTPAIVLSELGQTYVNEYLADAGFPLFITPTSKVLPVAKKHVGKKWDVKKKLANLENPVKVIENILAKGQLQV
ncbi:MAG: DUF354 domain-containing protein [Candidatus Bathyarchaeia archaeon]